MTSVSRELREQIRERAHFRCEYCHLPEGRTGRKHQLEHINPRKHDGKSVPHNLAWSCFQCNNAKSSEVGASDAVTGELTPYFNPRTQRWDDHFEMDGAVIIGKTQIGRVTALRLAFNDPDRVEARRIFIEAGVW